MILIKMGKRNFWMSLKITLIVAKEKIKKGVEVNGTGLAFPYSPLS